jgi:hypothetical protein
MIFTGYPFCVFCVQKIYAERVLVVAKNHKKAGTGGGLAVKRS